MARMIPLPEWAEQEFGDFAPHERILCKYAKANMIMPPAIKVGRRWMVDKEARYVGQLSSPKLPTNAHPKLKGIIEDGC